MFYWDDQPHYYSNVYAIEKQASTTQLTHDNKYFANVLCSVTGDTFTNLKSHIDFAAICNTISQDIVHKHFPDTSIVKSEYQPHSCGDSQPIKPLGQITLVCEKYNLHQTLQFQVLPAHIMVGKPALLLRTVS